MTFDFKIQEKATAIKRIQFWYWDNIVPKGENKLETDTVL